MNIREKSPWTHTAVLTEVPTFGKKPTTHQTLRNSLTTHISVPSAQRWATLSEQPRVFEGAVRMEAGEIPYSAPNADLT